jgi:hypothetical protein
MDLYTAPIVYSDPKRVAPKVEYPEGGDVALISDIYKLLGNINISAVVMPILGWFMATPFKPILNAARISFPHLALYGTTGAGKTGTLEAVFMPLLGYSSPARSEDCSTTPFVLMSLLASTNAIPVSLAEFRRATLGEISWKALLRTLLLAYDVGHDARGKPAQTTIDYPLHAPIVVSGEDVINDPAVQRRSIIVGMSPQPISPGTSAYEAFTKLTKLPLTQFALPYIRHTLSYDTKQIIAMWNAASKEVAQAAVKPLEERTQRNFATVLFGLRSYEAFMRSYGLEVLTANAATILQPIQEMQSESMDRGYVLLDSFAEDIINAAANANNQFVYMVDKDSGNILWFHLTTALQWWQQDRFRRHEATLDSASMKRQLKELSKNTPGNGHYVVGPKVWCIQGTSRRMYGFDIDTCIALGMDVPSGINILQRTITLHGGATMTPGKLEDSDE